MHKEQEEEGKQEEHIPLASLPSMRLRVQLCLLGNWTESLHGTPPIWDYRWKFGMIKAKHLSFTICYQERELWDLTSVSL